MLAINKLKIFVSVLMIMLITVPSNSLQAQTDLPDFTPVPPDVLFNENCLLPSCFWGIITKKQLKLCFIKIPSFPFVIPNPVAPAFHYYEIVQPWPPNFHRLYYVYTVLPEFGGTTKLRKRSVKTVYVNGKYLPGAAEAFRQTCTFNKDSLPKFAAGTISIWGTGCKAGEIVLYDLGKCKKPKK